MFLERQAPRDPSNLPLLWQARKISREIETRRNGTKRDAARKKKKEEKLNLKEKQEGTMERTMKK